RLVLVYAFKDAAEDRELVLELFLELTHTLCWGDRVRTERHCHLAFKFRHVARNLGPVERTTHEGLLCNKVPDALLAQLATHRCRVRNRQLLEADEHECCGILHDPLKL